MQVKINNIFTTIEGEGINVGVPSLFVRMGGCNIGCSFCDEIEAKTKYKTYSLEETINIIKDLLENNPGVKRLVFTGGNPLEQFDIIINMVDILRFQFNKVKMCLQHSGVFDYKPTQELDEIKPKVIAHIRLLIRSFDEICIDLKPLSSRVWERFSLEVSRYFIQCFDKNVITRLRKVDIYYNYPFLIKEDLEFLNEKFLYLINDKIIFLTPVRDKENNLPNREVFLEAINLIKNSPINYDLRLGYQIHKFYGIP